MNRAKWSAALMIVGSVVWLVGGILMWPSATQQLAGSRTRRS